MSFLLGTNICSEHIRRPNHFGHRFVQHSGRLHIPVLVAAELFAWVYRRSSAGPRLERVRDLIAELSVLPFDLRCAERFGRLHAELLAQGLTPSPVDLMIAAVALEHNLTVVTHNVADFRNVPGLRLEDWLTP